MFVLFFRLSAHPPVKTKSRPGLWKHITNFLTSLYSPRRGGRWQGSPFFFFYFCLVFCFVLFCLSAQSRTVNDDNTPTPIMVIILPQTFSVRKYMCWSGLPPPPPPPHERLFQGWRHPSKYPGAAPVLTTLHFIREITAVVVKITDIVHADARSVRASEINPRTGWLRFGIVVALWHHDVTDGDHPSVHTGIMVRKEVEL